MENTSLVTSMENTSSRDSLVELYKKWGRVQGELKEAEQINQLAVIPAINELRYAGRILVAALARHSQDLDLGAETDDPEIGEKSLEETIAIASQYITNAEHDISDALIYFFQKRADEINGRFGAKSVIARYPQYEEFINKLKEARHLIIDSRSDINKRHENYKSIKDITRYLIEAYYVLDKSDIYMSIEVEEYLLTNKKYKHFSIAFALVAFTAILFSFLW